MSHRASAILWLIMALFCGFLSLVACAGGGYSTWYTHDNVRRLEKSIEDDGKELKDKKKFVMPARREELDKRLAKSDKEMDQYVRYRYFAIAAAAISIIPAFMTLAFLVMAVAKFMKKTRPASQEDEDAEQPAEKKPTRKTKPKDDDS
jgi:hypothetical protein